MRTGRSCERLANYLKGHLIGTGNVLIESPKRLRDKSTGRLREHDVVLTVMSGQSIMLIGVECRGRSRPVGLPQLEAFGRKCTATSINKPVIVSSCGFTRTALCRAKALGIHCLSFEQVESFPWLTCETDPCPIRTKYTHIDFAIIPEKGFEKKSASFTLVNDDGETISPRTLLDYLFAALIQGRKNPSGVQSGDAIERISLLPRNLSIIDAETGTIEKVRQINLVAYSKNERELSFPAPEYKDAESDISFARINGMLEKIELEEIRTLLHRSIN
jgi:hypothetical protein